MQLPLFFSFKPASDEGLSAMSPAARDSHGIASTQMPGGFSAQVSKANRMLFMEQIESVSAL